MDNFELIAFVIGILYFLFGSGKKSKERSKRNNPQPKREKPAFDLEEMLRELTNQVEEKEAPVKQEPVPQKPRPSAKEAVFADPIEHHADTGRSIREIRQEIQKEKGLDKNKIAIEFDLRQAIINDAILRRPYE